MLRPAPVTQFFSFPITTAVAVGAIIVTLQSWAGQSIDMMVVDGRVWDQWQLWRALTSIFPHGSPMHLLFNLYWLWTFGTLLERVYGHVKYLGIVAILAFIAPLAEFMFQWSGIGLSGVVYGFWGMLWVLQRNDPRFIGVVDDRTSQMFVGWFFLCIILTHLGIFPVANIEHGAGAVAGFLLGFAVAGRGAAKLGGAIALLALIGLVTAGSTVWWPYVNLSMNSQAVVEGVGVDRLNKKDTRAAVKYFELAVKMRHADAETWHNLGVAYRDNGQLDKAVAAFIYSASRPDADAEMKKLGWVLEHPDEQTNGVIKN